MTNVLKGRIKAPKPGVFSPPIPKTPPITTNKDPKEMPTTPTRTGQREVVTIDIAPSP